MATRTDQHKHTHYTGFGVRVQPSCADADGFLAYRPDFRRRTADWTEAERWIAGQEDRIDDWRQADAREGGY